MTTNRRDCDVENVQDFARYYGQAWVGWHPTDSAYIIPEFVGGIRANHSVQFRSLSKTPLGDFKIDPPTDVSWEEIQSHIDFGLPPIGMYTDGPTIVYGSYTSPRSPRKGYRPTELTLHEFNNWTIRSKYSRYARENYEWVWHSFNPEYKTLEHALKILEAGEKVGVPISRTLGVYTLPQFKNPMLAYKRWRVGYVLDSSTICLTQQYADYETDISRQTEAKVIFV